LLPPYDVIPYNFPSLALIRPDCGYWALLSKDLATDKLFANGINLIRAPPPSVPPPLVSPYKVCACMESMYAKQQTILSNVFFI
jgi:hypothetical protein